MQGMNYVVASLLLGRIPEQYTDINHCTPLAAENEEGGCFLCNSVSITWRSILVFLSTCWCSFVSLLFVEMYPANTTIFFSKVPTETPDEESTPDPDPDHSSGTSGFEVAASVVRAVVMDNSNMSGMLIVFYPKHFSDCSSHA